MIFVLGGRFPLGGSRCLHYNPWSD